MTSKLCRDIQLRVAKVINILLVTIPIGVCWYAYYAENILLPFYRRGNWAVIALFVVLYMLFAKLYDGLKISSYRISEMIYSQGLSLLMSDVISYVVVWLLMRRIPEILPALVTMLVQLVLTALWSLVAHKWYFRVFPPRRTAVIYGERRSIEKLIGEYGLDKKFEVCTTVAASECIENLQVLGDVETVFISDVGSHERNMILKYCVANDIDIYCIPRIGDIIMSGARQMHMFHLPILRVGRYRPSPDRIIIKRLFDIVVSGLILLVTSPVFLVTAVAIKAGDGGPVFYKQERLTKDGKVFKVLKFRSMRVDAEKDGVARLSTGDRDDRITPVGKIIRKLRIDELPQLLNIFSGRMSVVGPRPERPEIAAQYEQTLPEFRLRLQVKAGLTGYAQVYGKYNTTPYDKLQMDLMYIANPSFIEDIRIVLATVKILFQPESTDGVAEGQTTAQKAEEDDALVKSK